jgi:hypothetical protein
MMSTPQTVAVAASTTTPHSLLRLRMVLDSINSDEVLISFKSGTSSKYVVGEDAIDLGGNGAPEGLSVLSSDSVKLAISQVPFPTAKRQIIPLSVNAIASYSFQLTVPELQNIPETYQIWLKDNFTGDSVKLKQNSSYSFSIDKSNPATFGSKRLSIIISQDTAYTYRLLGFTAARIGNSSNVQTHWTTANEDNQTNFTVERSTDGSTFTVVGGLWATGAGDYGLMDKNVPVGTNLYRLRSQDISNTITYSNTALVLISQRGNADKIRLYPNPAASLVTVSLTSEIKNPAGYYFTITDNFGQIVKQGDSVQSNWQTSICALPPGAYILQVVNRNDKSFIGKSKFVKL